MIAKFYPRWKTRIFEHTALAVFGVAVIVRLANLLSLDDLAAHVFAEDSAIYWRGAQAWLDAGFFARPDGANFVPETERVPLYHLFLVPFRWAFGEALVPVLVAQILIDSCTCILIAKLCREMNEGTALIAGLSAALWPNLIIHSQLIFGDALFVFLLTLFLLLAVRFMQTVRWPMLLYAGLVCGFAILTRSIALFIPFLSAIVAPFVTWRRRGRWLPGIGAGAVMVVATLLVLSPLLWRNATQFGTFQLTSQNGAHFLYWVVGYAVGLEQGKPFSQASREMRLRLQAKLEREGRKPVQELEPFEASATMMEHVYQELEHMSATTLAKAWATGAMLNLGAPALLTEPRIRALNEKSLINTAGSGLFDRVVSFVRGNNSWYVFWAIAAIALSVISCMLQFAGLIIALRLYFWPAIFGCLIVAYFLLINGPIGAPKYRLPFEPVMIIFQAVALTSFFSLMNNLRINRRGQGVVS